MPCVKRRGPGRPLPMRCRVRVRGCSAHSTCIWLVATAPMPRAAWGRAAFMPADSASPGILVRRGPWRAKGCALGLGAACEAQEDHLALADAIEPYRKACELAPASPHACLKLARAYERMGGEAWLVDSSYRRACARLSFAACLWVSRSGEARCRGDGRRRCIPAMVRLRLAACLRAREPAPRRQALATRKLTTCSRTPLRCSPAGATRSRGDAFARPSNSPAPSSR